MAATKNNIQWLDMLRALATIGVIVVHVSSPLVNMTYAKNMPYWWIGNIIDSMVRFSVPMFLMLSGATLLIKDYNLLSFYKKRISRVFVPFVFWVVAYAIYRYAMLYPNEQPHQFDAIVQWGIDLFLTEGNSKHLWYVYMILFIYLFVPVIGKWLRGLSNYSVLAVLIAWAIVSFACKAMPINQYCWSSGYGDKLLGYFLHTGYLVLGFYLANINIKFKQIKFYSAVVFFLCAISTAIIVYFSSKNANKLDLSFYSYFTPLSILQTSALFLWVRDVTVQNSYLSLIQSTISNYSYGIYLVHIMVIGISFRYGIFWTMAHPIVSIPLVVVFTLISSFGIIYVLRRIPFGKYVAG